MAQEILQPALSDIAKVKHPPDISWIQEGDLQLRFVICMTRKESLGTEEMYGAFDDLRRIIEVSDSDIVELQSDVGPEFMELTDASQYPDRVVVFYMAE